MTVYASVTHLPYWSTCQLHIHCMCLLLPQPNMQNESHHESLLLNIQMTVYASVTHLSYWSTCQLHIHCMCFLFLLLPQHNMQIRLIMRACCSIYKWQSMHLSLTCHTGVLASCTFTACACSCHSPTCRMSLIMRACCSIYKPESMHTPAHHNLEYWRTCQNCTICIHYLCNQWAKYTFIIGTCRTDVKCSDKKLIWGKILAVVSTYTTTLLKNKQTCKRSC
jgi:hypothetical protein